MGPGVGFEVTLLGEVVGLEVTTSLLVDASVGLSVCGDIGCVFCCKVDTSQRQ